MWKQLGISSLEKCEKEKRNPCWGTDWKSGEVSGYSPGLRHSGDRMILPPSLWPALCLLADAFISLTLCLAHLNKKSSARALLKASEHSSSVSISTDVMCLTFKSHGPMYCSLWEKKGLITALDHCHSILASGTEAHWWHWGLFDIGQ